MVHELLCALHVGCRRIIRRAALVLVAAVISAVVLQHRQAALRARGIGSLLHASPLWCTAMAVVCRRFLRPLLAELLVGHVRWLRGEASAAPTARGPAPAIETAATATCCRQRGTWTLIGRMHFENDEGRAIALAPPELN